MLTDFENFLNEKTACLCNFHKNRHFCHGESTRKKVQAELTMEILYTK